MPTVPLSLFHPVRALPPPPLCPQPLLSHLSTSKSSLRRGAGALAASPHRRAQPERCHPGTGGAQWPPCRNGLGATPTQGDKPGKGDSRIWEERSRIPDSIPARVPGRRRMLRGHRYHGGRGTMTK